MADTVLGIEADMDLEDGSWMSGTGGRGLDEAPTPFPRVEDLGIGGFGRPVRSPCKRDRSSGTERHRSVNGQWPHHSER
jgi:hypothetical protein